MIFFLFEVVIDVMLVNCFAVILFKLVFLFSTGMFFRFFSFPIGCLRTRVLHCRHWLSVFFALSGFLSTTSLNARMCCLRFVRVYGFCGLMLFGVCALILLAHCFPFFVCAFVSLCVLPYFCALYIMFSISIVFSLALFCPIVVCVDFLGDFVFA